MKVRSAPSTPAPGPAVHAAAEPPRVEPRPHAPEEVQPREPEAPAEEPDSPATIAEKMTEANRLYDHGDYEAAGQMAKDVLKAEPQNLKMLRISASAACILGDSGEARVYYDQLPERDQQQIARRCRRYGIEF